MWISAVDALATGYTIKGVAKAAVYCFGVSVFLGLFFSAPFASAQTASSTDLQTLVRQLQAQIESLQTQIRELKSQLAAPQTEFSPAPQSPQTAAPNPEIVASPAESAGDTGEKQEILFIKPLQRGARGDDVRKLQEFLSKFSDIYPQGLVTGFYGPATEAAVKKFQQKHGFEQVGFIGPRTIAKINELLSEGAAHSGVVPSGLLRASGVVGSGTTAIPAPAGVLSPVSPSITGVLTATATSSSFSSILATTSPAAFCAADPKYCATREACVGAGFHWYTVSCHRVPPVVNSCAASYNYCIGPTECAAHGWYSCRGSCYPSLEACQGESYVPPATPAPIPAIPAQPIGHTGTTTVPAMPPVSAFVAATSTATTTPVDIILKVTAPNGGEQLASGSGYRITWTSTGTSVATVNIDLYKSEIYHSFIASNAANTGSVLWTVPSLILAGADYKIRIYNSSYHNNFDQSDNAFGINVPVSAPSSAPIGYWKFDGNGGNEITGSPSAVAVGGAVFRASGGKFGGYLYMPSGNDYAKIPYNSMFDLQNFTVEFWFRQRANQGFNQNLISKGAPPNNYNFNIFRNLWNQFNNGAVIAGSTASGTGYWHQVSNNNEPPHNAWHHVVYTKTTEGAAYYIDGALIHSRNYVADRSPEYAGPVRTPAIDIIIGNPAPDTDIDNLRIYNYALSRGEVLYNLEQVPGIAPPPVSSDTAPPVISSIQATNITATSAAISWTTDEAADSQVEYGAMTSYGLQTALDANRAVSHAAALTGLAASTAYHYRVKSKDAAGNPAISADQTFTTAQAPPPANSPTIDLKWSTAYGSGLWNDGTLTIASPAYYYLQWTSSNATGECSPGGTWAQSGSKALNGSHNFADVTIVGLKTYSLICSNAYGSATDSVYVNVIAPLQVQGLTAMVSNMSVNLSWQPVSGISTYNVYRGTSADFIADPSNRIAQVSVLTHTDSNLAAGTYYYKVAAQDKSSNVGLASAAASATVVSSGYAFTVRGRLANAITKEPVTNSNLYIWNWKGSMRRDFPLQSDGSFAINLTADDLANASATYVNAVHNYSKACYDQSSFSIFKTASGGVDYVHVQETAGNGQTTRRVAPVGAEANIGDFLTWPVTGFSLTSDIPVKFEGLYYNGRSGGGNINYRTSHGFSTFLPVNISMAIALTDQAGTRYVSPYVTYGLSQHCNQASLNFAGGQFSWNPTGTISVSETSPSLAALLKSIGAILSEMERIARGLAR